MRYNGRSAIFCQRSRQRPTSFSHSNPYGNINRDTNTYIDEHRHTNSHIDAYFNTN